MNDNTKAEQGIWRLISPSGEEYQATSPLQCCRAEIDKRVPIALQFERMLKFAKSEDPPLLKNLSSAIDDWINCTEYLEGED